MDRHIKIDASHVIAHPNPKMWGIFYEEINHAGDGGLYAEQLRNRNFTESNIPEGTVWSGGTAQTKNGHREAFTADPPLPGWKLTCDHGCEAVMRKVTDLPRNPDCPEQLQLSVMRKSGVVRLYNGGYWGISPCQNGYHGFIIARGEGITKAEVGLARSSSFVLAQTVIEGISDNFGKFEFELAATDATDAIFFISVETSGTLWLDFVSLFPNSTYKNRRYGLRADLAAMLEGLRPGFIRFPGGCVVEGINLQNAIHWKKTTGPIEDRPGHWDLWSYRCTDGLGMHEYLQLCEDLGADAMYVCNCGMSCQYRSGEVADSDTLDTWLSDALDAIEYAVGDTATKWGGERAKNGHPEPFPLRYVEIGNENWGDAYAIRYRKFYDAIKSRYPSLMLIADCRVPDAAMDMVDDHYYTPPQTMPQISDKYEHAMPGETPVYVGEYACNTDVGYGNLISAISEACFMVGMERAADTVRIASYAPLFCNVNDRKWPVNLINFDRSRVFGLPSYYVQRLFAENNPDCVVAVDGGNRELFVTAGIKGDELIIKAAHFGPTASKVKFSVGTIALTGEGTDTLIGGEDGTATNSLLYPEDISPAVGKAELLGDSITLSFPAYSFRLIKLKIKN
jgi:Alpha-L-arabinofuranosidase